MKLFLLNGPPSSGKDAAAKSLYNPTTNIFERFSQPLKASFAAISGRPINEFFEVDYYEENKEEVVPWLGVSYRQYQINLSESHFKPFYGTGIFARMFYDRCLYKTSVSGIENFIVPDTGFEFETIFIEQQEVLLDHDALLIRVRRDGTDFSADSRSYINTYRFPSIDVSNNDTLEAYEAKMAIIYDAFINNTEGDDINDLLNEQLTRDEYGYY